MLDVPHEVVEYVSWLINARRCELNSRWRRLGCFTQALLALVHLRKNETLAQLGAAFGVSTAAVGRYVTEAVDVPAEQTRVCWTRPAATIRTRSWSWTAPWPGRTAWPPTSPTTR
jgi:hypothetical protein